RYLFHEAGFHGNRDEYYDPRNSFLNDVLDRQTGIPITLSVVAMAVGERLGLRIDGLALPGHFVVMARSGGRRIIFDPFHGGKRLEARLREVPQPRQPELVENLRPQARGCGARRRRRAALRRWMAACEWCATRQRRGP